DAEFGGDGVGVFLFVDAGDGGGEELFELVGFDAPLEVVEGVFGLGVVVGGDVFGDGVEIAFDGGPIEAVGDVFALVGLLDAGGDGFAQGRDGVGRRGERGGGVGFTRGGGGDLGHGLDARGEEQQGGEREQGEAHGGQGIASVKGGGEKLGIKPGSGDHDNARGWRGC